MKLSKATVQDERGFALTEALVGVAIAALAIASIASLFPLWSAAKDRADRTAKFMTSANDTSALFLRSVDQLIIPSTAPGGGVDGTDLEVQFLSWPPTGGGKDGFVTQRWRFEPETHRLMWTADEGGNESEIVIQANVTVRFNYLGRPSETSSQSAASTWDATWLPPSHIKMKISSRSAVETYEYVGKIRAERPQICAYQPDHAKCASERQP